MLVVSSFLYIWFATF
ncbi:LpxT activity modulator PmrR [Shigella boydii]|nr:LpxT activity modulator PmrR [Shigella boydii]